MRLRPTSGLMPGRAGAFTATALNLGPASADRLWSPERRAGGGRSRAARAPASPGRGSRSAPVRPERRRQSPRVLAHQRDAVILFRSRATSTPAGRRSGHGPVAAGGCYPVLLGQQAEVVGPLDLQVSHPRRQHRARAREKAAQHKAAPADLARPLSSVSFWVRFMGYSASASAGPDLTQNRKGISRWRRRPGISPR